MSCSGVRDDLVAYVDGELSPAAAEAIEAHLGACPACRAEVAAHRSVWDALDVLERDLAPRPGWVEEVEARIVRGDPRGRRAPAAAAWAAAAAAVLVGVLFSLAVPPGSGEGVARIRGAVTPTADPPARRPDAVPDPAGDPLAGLSEEEEVVVENLELLEELEELDELAVLETLDLLEELEPEELDEG